MNNPRLLDEYRKLCPALTVVYVIPHIGRFSRHNPYLQLLYAPLMNVSNPAVQIRSTSFFSPLIIWRRLCGEQSVLHHHWFEFQNGRMLLNALWKIFCAGLYRLAGGKIVWTVHNCQPHADRYRTLNRLLRRLWAKLPHRIHVHCRSAIPLLVPLLGVSGEKFFVIAHPPYPARKIPRASAREYLHTRYPQLPLPPEETVFLMFGYIARYKGILEVMQIFRREGGHSRLIVAGAPKKGDESYISELLEIEQKCANIHLIAAHIPEADVPLFLSAADYVVFNYADILESGGVALARSYQCRLIIPNRGCLQELSGSDIWKFHNGEELAQVIATLSHPHSAAGE